MRPARGSAGTGGTCKLNGVSETNLSRRLSTSIVDAFKARGHIAVTKGGAAALARELEEQMADDIETVAPRLDPWASVDAEVTVTHADGALDDQVEELIVTLTRTIVDSEHVEDVYAEDKVIHRDLLRVLRDSVLGTRRDLGGEDEGPARVRLDALGYVAAVVARRAPSRTLRDALSRAAQNVGCKLNAYDPEACEATFSLSEATFSITVADPDARLDLEQAVADELADLVATKVVALPTVERRVPLADAVAAAARGLRDRIDAVATKLLRQGGCVASWELDGEGALKVTITPMSEQDALEVDRRVAQLAREIVALAGAAPAEKSEPSAEAEAPVGATAAKKRSAAKKAAAPAKKAASKKAAAPARKPAAKKPAAKKPAAKKPAAKKPAAKKPAAKKPAAKKPAAKKPAAKKPAAKKPAAKKPAAKKPAAKKAAARARNTASKPAKKTARKAPAKR